MENVYLNANAPNTFHACYLIFDSVVELLSDVDGFPVLVLQSVLARVPLQDGEENNVQGGVRRV